MQTIEPQLKRRHDGVGDRESDGRDDYVKACLVEATLRQCDQGIKFVESAVSRFSLPESQRAMLIGQISAIRERRSDRSLYLAIVGEFSSGKSTLINALIGAELLPTGAIPTTSVVTKVQYGPRLSVEVCFRNDCRAAVTLCGTKASVAEIAAFLRAIMMDPDKAADVAEIRITHNAPFLANGIVIIDTPGCNAPDAGHAEITKRVVGLIADCAVVLTPADRPVSLELVDFLNNHLKPYLHRCVYMVTKMDQLREKDREAVLSYAESHLAERLGLAGVEIRSVAAQVSLDSLNSSDLPASKVVWVDRFRVLEKAVAFRLKRERAIAIAERIARLQLEVFGQIEVHLKAAVERFRRREERITAELIPDLPAFTKKQRSKLEKEVQTIRGWAFKLMAKEVASFGESCVTGIRRSVFLAQTPEALKSICDSSPSVLRAGAQAAKGALARILADVPNRVLATMTTFDRTFQDTYARLERASGETIRFPALPSDAVEFKLAPPEPHMPETPKLPVLQRILEWIFGVDILKLQLRAWQELEPWLSKYFPQIEKEAGDACEQYLTTACKSLDSRISHYIGAYGQIVATIMERENQEQLRMHLLSNMSQLYVLEARRQASSLLNSKEHLAGSA